MAGSRLFGLTAAVDELQLTFVVASDASLFDPSRWAIDLAGLAINADMAGITLAGGMRKFGDGDNVEYVGMLLARFAVYGLSVYGGYGSAVVERPTLLRVLRFRRDQWADWRPSRVLPHRHRRRTGHQSRSDLPLDLSRFGDFPFLKALDPAAQPQRSHGGAGCLRQDFPMKRGEFWFAAGISFTCFALVDGIAVVSVKIGDGLEIAILGLARMALPRPAVRAGRVLNSLSGAVLHQRRRALDPGPADRQLLAAKQSRAPDRRLRLRNLVQGSQQRAICFDPWRLSSALPS